MASIPEWRYDVINGCPEVGRKISVVAWPGSAKSLEAAAQATARAFQRFYWAVMEEAELENTNGLSTYSARPLYRRAEYNDDYSKGFELGERFEDWVNKTQKCLYEAAKYLNWFGDLVRAEMNPLFFAEAGRFGLMFSPTMEDLRYIWRVPELSVEEIADAMKEHGK